jgi:tetratricopeptide (TPR) repeat protein
VGALRRDAARSGGGLVERRVPATRAAALAALAFAILWLEAGGFGALWRRRLDLVSTALACAAAAPLAFATGDGAIAWLEQRLRERPGDARLLVALGVARAEEGRETEAAHALRAAAVGARDPGDAALAYYDLGVLELSRDRLEAARDAFLDALALAPDDAEARFNLEWTLRALAAAPPAKQKKDEEEQEQDKQRPEPELPDPSQQGGGERPPPGGPRPAPQFDLAAAERFAPELSPDRVERWLDAVADDPSRGLRDAAREQQGRRGGPERW